MATIALVSIGLPGHVNPTLGLTAELVRRGHRVRYYCSPAMASAITRAGAELVDYPTALPTLSGGSRPDLLLHHAEECERTLPALVEAFTRDRPDVVIHNFISFGARLASECVSTPSVTFFTSYALNGSFNIFSQTLVMNTPPEGVEAVRTRIEALCRRVGCAPIDLTVAIAQPPQDSLTFVPRRFQPCEETFDASYHFVGSCLYERDDPGPGEFPGGVASAASTGASNGASTGATGTASASDGRRNVLIAMGTIFPMRRSFYEACLHAFEPRCWHVVMSVGTEKMVAELGDAPANIQVSAHVRQLELLPHADLLISHGGMNSVIEAFTFGVPMINIPQTGEHIFTAERVEALGLGRRLRRDEVTAATLAASADEIVRDQAYRERLAEMQRETLAAGGSARAADIVESVLGRD